MDQSVSFDMNTINKTKKLCDLKKIWLKWSKVELNKSYAYVLTETEKNIKWQSQTIKKKQRVQKYLFNPHSEFCRDFRQLFPFSKSN